MKHYFTLGIFYVLTMFALGQNTFESEIGDAVTHKPSPEIKFYTRSSFVSNDPVNVFGLKIGINFNRTISFGLGYNQLRTNIYKWYPVLGNNPILAKLELKYVTVYSEYTFHTSKRWEFNIPVQLGAGYTWYKELNTGKVREDGFVAMYEPGIIANFKVIRFLSVGAGAGYRLMIINNRKLNKQLTVPQYMFRVKIHISDIIQSLNGTNTTDNE